MLLCSLFWAIPFVNLVLNRMVVSVPVPRSLSFSFYSLAVADIRDGHLASAEVHLSKCVQYDPEDTEVLQLLGVIRFKLGNASVAIQLLHRANELLNYQDLDIVSNLVEILRSSGELQKASEVGHEALRVVGLNREQDCAGLLINLGIVEAAQSNLFLAENLYRRAATAEPASPRAWQLYADIVLKRSGLEAETILRDGILVHPEDFSLHFMLGTALQLQQKYATALKTYLTAEAINDNDCQLQVNIASTYQSMGLVKEAEHYYVLALPHCPEDAGLFNNYAALLEVLGRDHEQYLWLHKALDINPFLMTALINLAGYYQDEGDLASARELLHRAASPLAAAAVSHALGLTSISADILHLRAALMLSPICASWPQMWEERVNITRKLQALMDAASAPVNPSKILLSEVDSSIDRIHFYISYHGLNDRSLQDLIMDVYRLYLRIEYFSPHFLDLPHESFPRWITPPPAPTEGIVGAVMKRRARIGFISKFLGIFEPLGMLLDGVMRYLPREHFEVIALAVTRDDATPLSPTAAAACDEVHTVSLTYSHAQAMLQELRLDVLVFADTLSEPMTHFLAHSRLAPIQMAFWGNPITSGSQQIDFFISADVMEHPHRTRMPIADEPYTEQVVLMEGQGIWYLRPDIAGDLASSNLTHLVAAPRTFSRTDFGLQEDCFLYALPQSTFKIHPLYDLVLRDILGRAPDSHLVVTGGRRPRWTEIYVTRLQNALGPELPQRLHVIERVSSEQFLALLEISDVILHPFPFDGSKTSADALRVHKPLVTLPTEYLRGRMGAAFMYSMNLPELVAHNRSEYVDIAVRLKSDRGFYQQMVGLIAEREDLIWEDMTVPFTWSNLLSGIIGVRALEWEEFLAQTGRDVALEKQRTLARERNAALFQQRWGKETWLLPDGVAALETMLDSADQQPCVFLDWNCAD